jgi:hypothetical protein
MVKMKSYSTITFPGFAVMLTAEQNLEMEWTQGGDINNKDNLS